jgi:FRG domain-containing protein
MPASFSVDDPAHWRGRGAETRPLADEMKDKISRRMILEIADVYERLAKHVEERAKKRYFACRDIHSWDDFVQVVSGHASQWVYRGQQKDQPLQSSLEKCIRDWDSDIGFSPAIERQMIRDFRRRYPDQTDAAIRDDTLYCLTMMQHHGAPTRLMDWTYSPFVAAKFAAGEGTKDAAIWCLNAKWCQTTAAAVVGNDLKLRDGDAFRNDLTFRPIYLDGHRPFVCLENPLRLNQRLVLQRGIFLCPGNISLGFEQNIEAMDGWDSDQHLVKLVLDLDKARSAEFANNLKQMNMTSAVLFPGFDGFARSLRELILHYENLARHGTGSAGSTVPMWGWHSWRPRARSLRISIDDASRTYRDRKAITIKAAEHLKRKQPHSAVVVKDLQSGAATRSWVQTRFTLTTIRRAAMSPNFVLLDASLSDVARLVTAMVQARDAVDRRSWSHPQEPTTEEWWADVLADPRGRISKRRSDYTAKQAFYRLATSCEIPSSSPAVSATGRQPSVATSW